MKDCQLPIASDNSKGQSNRARPLALIQVTAGSRLAPEKADTFTALPRPLSRRPALEGVRHNAR
jgi:hypothetical protein